MTRHDFLTDVEDGKLEKTFPLLSPSIKVAVIFNNQRKALLETALLETEMCLKKHTGRSARCFNVL